MASADEARVDHRAGSWRRRAPRADAAVVKAVIAVLHVLGDRRDVPVVAEIDDAETSWALRDASADRLLTVRSSEVIARITAQACRQSGLSAVCQELLDFEGDEIYFQHVDELTGHTFGEALLAFETSSVIGLRRGDGPIAINPPMDTVIDRRRRRHRDLGGRRHRRVRRVPRRVGPDAAARRPAVPNVARAAPRRRLEPAWARRCSRSSTSSRSPGSTVDVIVDPDVVGPDELDDLGLERLGVRYEAERGDLDELTQTVSGRTFDHVIILGYRSTHDRRRGRRTHVAHVAAAPACSRCRRRTGGGVGS